MHKISLILPNIYMPNVFVENLKPVQLATKFPISCDNWLFNKADAGLLSITYFTVVPPTPKIPTSAE